MSGDSISLSNSSDLWPNGADNAGNQTINGNDGNDSIDAGTGDDWLKGGRGNDSLIGGGGNDTIQTGEGNDTVLGGDGIDLANFSLASQPVTVHLATGGKWGGDYDSLIGIENVLAGSANDTLLGDSLDNVLDGNAGDDTLDGGVDETIADTLIGGDGSDFVSFASAASGVTVDLVSAAPQTIGGGAGADQLFSIENLVGSAFDDGLIGGAGDNSILGGNGADTVLGGAGNDWLDFGAGNERLQRNGSEISNDTLIGGLGNDTLDLGSDWSCLSQSGGFSLYQDDSDIIWAQGRETVVCFGKGTRIVTPKGEDLVENLRAGDMVLAMRNGQAGFEPLRWVGFMDIAVPRNAVMAAKTAPVLIKAGALAPGMPGVICASARITRWKWMGI